MTWSDEEILIDNQRIPIYAEADARKLPWRDLKIDVVLECTGRYTSKTKAQAHIDAGAKKVLISAPAGEDLPTIVYGVNHKTIKKEDHIISGASCTTNCLAPMAKTLNEYRELRTGFMTTIHAYTGDQMLLDGPHKKGDLRRARAGAINIVPNSTGAAKAIGLVIPELEMPVYQTMPEVDITCLDYSPDMMRQAREKADRLHLKNVTFRQGDVGALPYEDDTFDIVLSLNGFHAFPDKEAAYREVFRVLRP